MDRILILHGPNLNLLGRREQAVYGKTTLNEINSSLTELAAREGVELDFFQTNHEGELVEKIQQSEGRYAAVVLNAAGFTHTSVAIRDAVAAVSTPVVEVHLSNIHAREEFRKESLLSPVARGVVFGFGAESYALGLKGAIALTRGR